VVVGCCLRLLLELFEGLRVRITTGNAPVDLDLSVVGISTRGEVLMDGLSWVCEQQNIFFSETVYFGDLTNSNGSIRHSGFAI